MVCKKRNENYGICFKIEHDSQLVENFSAWVTYKCQSDLRHIKSKKNSRSTKNRWFVVFEILNNDILYHNSTRKKFKTENYFWYQRDLL